MKNIILQGLPGVGKTTLTKKIANKLKDLAVDVTGFYTEELRENNYRIGFDVVTLDNKRGILARKTNAGDNSKYKVGNYSVHIEEFEKLVLPIFDNVKSIIIIDEIGKMEMFSKTFQANVERVITDKSIRVVATVPLKASLPLVQKIKNSNTSRLITVSAGNRDRLLDEIIPLLTK